MSKSSKAPTGMIAKRSQDRSHASVTVVEYVDAPPSKSKRTVVKCYLCNKPMSFKGIAPIGAICADCEAKANKAAIAEQKRIDAERIAAEQAEIDSRIHKVCKTCGKSFYIKAKKAEELKNNGLELFACCFACQQVKANNKTDEKE